MFTNLIPLRNEVKVRALPKEDIKNDLGIFIPSSSTSFTEKLFKAEILAVGPEVMDMCCMDIVVCQYHTGIEIDPDIIVIKETDIVGILKHKECAEHSSCCKHPSTDNPSVKITD